MASTRVTQSAVIKAPIDKVWGYVRNFDFAKSFSSVQSCTLEGQAHTIGTVRKLTWADGQWKKQRLIELSDLHFRSVWEMTEAEPHAEVTAVITTLQLYRITEDNTTLAVYSNDFSADATAALIKFEQKAALENLQEIRKHI